MAEVELPVTIVRRGRSPLLKDPRRLSVGLLPSMGKATRRALFHGIGDEAGQALQPSEWARDLDQIVRHRLAGLALAAARADGVSLDEATDSHLQWTRNADSMRSLAVEAAAPHVIEKLQEAGVPSVITKGPGIARAYPLPALRPFRDIDLLVPPDRFGVAKRVLGELGFHSLPERERPRPYFHRYCREAINLYREGEVSIDLHHRIPPWIWGRRLSFRSVRQRSEELRLPGGPVRIADPIHNLLIASLHLISDGGRPGQTLLIWRDLVALAGVCQPEEAAKEARRQGLDWCLALVLRELPEFARPTELLRHLAEARPGRRDAFRLRHLLPPAVGSHHLVGQAFRLPVANAAAFIVGYLVPTRAFLQHRYGKKWAYREWWRDALGRFREAQSLP
jgi:hypothetical protein